MKHVYNYQEIGTLIDQGKPVAFTRMLEARISAVQMGSSGGEACAVRDLSGIVMYRYPQHVDVGHTTPVRLTTPLYKTCIMPEQNSSFVPVARSVVPHVLFS